MSDDDADLCCPECGAKVPLEILREYDRVFFTPSGSVEAVYCVDLGCKHCGHEWTECECEPGDGWHMTHEEEYYDTGGAV